MSSQRLTRAKSEYGALLAAFKAIDSDRVHTGRMGFCVILTASSIIPPIYSIPSSIGSPHESGLGRELKRA